MADTQLAGTGHRGQFWLSTDETEGNLARMNEVKSFAIPKKLRDFVETTHLDSDAKEYAPTLPDSDEIEVTLNYRPGSDTDAALEAASEDADPRLMRLIVPIRGVLTRQFSFLGYITYSPGEDVNVEDVMESTVTIRVTGDVTAEAYGA
jgi:hypothetical protein